MREKPQFSENELELRRQELLQLQQGLESLASNERVNDAADAAQDSDDASEVLDMAREEQIRSGNVVRRIDNALLRIKNGVYGVCLGSESKDHRISKARLNAIPYAEYCVDCQRKRERSQVRQVIAPVEWFTQ